MTENELQEMTVLQLRQVAKQNGVKLSAGINKAEIVAAIMQSQKPSTAAPLQIRKADGRPLVRQGKIIIDDEDEYAHLSGDDDDHGDEDIFASLQTLKSVSDSSSDNKDDGKENDDEQDEEYTPPPAKFIPPSSPLEEAGYVPEQPRRPMIRREPAAYQQPSAPVQRPSYAGAMQGMRHAYEAPAQTSRYPSRAGTVPPAYQAPRPAAPQPAMRPAYQAPRPQAYQPQYQQPEIPAPAPRAYAPEPYAPAPQVNPYVDGAYGRQSAGYGEQYTDPYHRRDTGYYNKELGTSNPAVPEMLQSGECGDGAGVLEIHPDGYGFLRADNFLPGIRDVYVSIAQIRRFALRTGDYVVGKTRPQREGDKYHALLYITEVNGHAPDDTTPRINFDELTPVYPSRKLILENEKNVSEPDGRLIDLIAPIGFGQRAMIVAPPKAGKTLLLKKIANSVALNYPDAHLMILLVDERPEEVTDIKENVKGEVLYSTFDELPENHIRVAEMVLERAKRLVEQKQDVVVLMDSLTRLSRAYNAVAPQTGRALSGGLAAGAMHKPKKFFGAARALREGGSLTVIATALVETGSRMDDIIFEEFKGTGNMELVLDRKLADRRIFPAINMQKSGTRREELLLDDKGRAGLESLRNMMNSLNEADALLQLLSMIEKTSSNEQLLDRLPEWLKMMSKSDR
ncbi:MAG: transcription termination factor Rho [Eubacteriales bacterium]|nr:transcription termination factor Rho [Eubacteriales bacterium]MDD3880801.1 transcription termination factor Rho [Eubacteriales bacterium]MDD4511832.1 transcription termination factor Rho [Eubacteriales bacterium]